MKINWKRVGWLLLALLAAFVALDAAASVFGFQVRSWMRPLLGAFVAFVMPSFTGREEA